MLPVELVSGIIALMKDAPELEAAISADLELIRGGTLTADQLAANIQTARNIWGIAKQKWAAAATGDKPLTDTPRSDQPIS